MNAPEAARRAQDSPWLAARFVVPLLVAVVIASRWLAISTATELNPDESQVMAQALRYGIDPVPWRGVDGTTGGPANSWFLYLAHRLGMPLDYRWVHALGAALQAAMCVLTYATLRQVAGGAAAAAGGAVAALSIALAQDANFTHFSSELVPALLTSAVLLCVAVRLVRPRHALVLDCLAGVLLGMLPWAKLQAILGAVVLAAWIAWLILRESDGDRGAAPSGRLRRLLLFAGMIALPGALILGIVVAGGAWNDFWMSYVRANAAYAGRFSLLAAAKKIYHLFQSPSSRLLVGLFLFAAGWWWLGRPGWRSASSATRRFVIATALFAVATALAVLTPRTPYPHYQILLLQPVALLAGAILGMWASDRQQTGDSRYAVKLFAVCMLLVPLTGMPSTVRAARATFALRAAQADLPARRVAREIRSISPDARRMAVWGWMPSFYVETGIPPATRHAVCIFVIEPSPAREHLRASFLSDIRREKPDVIVDAVADGCFRWNWDSSKRLQSFPEFAQYVRRNYVLASERNFGEDPVRLYLSNDYLESRGRVGLQGW